MAFEMDGRLREERDLSGPERQDTLVDFFGSEPKEAADDASGPEDTEITEIKPRVLGDAAPRREAGFSRDLIDTYFRQMGGAELLSREEEVALAKRIEAAQLAVLKSLCSIPMLIERLERWGCELREGRLRLRDLIDIAVHHEVARHGGTNQTALGPRDENEDADGADDASLLAGVTALLDGLSFARARDRNLEPETRYRRQPRPGPFQEHPGASPAAAFALCQGDRGPMAAPRPYL